MVVKSSEPATALCRSSHIPSELDSMLTVSYRRAWAAVLSLGAIWVATTVLQLVQYTLSNRAKERKWAELTPEEQEAYKDQSSKEPISKRLDARYAL